MTPPRGIIILSIFGMECNAGQFDLVECPDYGAAVMKIDRI
ncbi:MAG: hypothetical protein ACLFQX_00585 [Candidatus Kapaibacterium sp.]